MPGLTASAVNRSLDDDGYAVVDHILDPTDDLQPLLADFAGVLDQLAGKLLAGGEVTSTYAELPFGPRLIRLTRECGHSLSQHFDLALPNGGIRSETPIHISAAVFAVLTNPRLLDLAEELLGPEIAVSPVGHVRIKLPEGTLPDGGDGLMAQIPWHQDNGVVLEEADGIDVLTVWIPVNAATIPNGCMQVVPTSRRHDLQPHCPADKKGLHIPDPFVDEDRAVPLPMEAGSVLLMHPRTIHSSLPNLTEDQVRISLDLRYQPADQPTGRPMFPSFIARSRSNPERELRDWRVWSQQWLDVRARLAADPPPAYNRWDPNAPACA
ncbi:MAG TPA: phytanoyl-CoA dioxygenase family protein [Mycobacteriales bacterium]|nr:phytanoyl-CoA dioxygenase family protein [Mycobacteriales bacterium]